MELKVNDMVKVVNGGCAYTTYEDFMTYNKNEHTKPWLYDKEVENGTIGIVNVIKTNDRHEEIAIVNTGNGSFIINTKGLEKVLRIDLDVSKIIREERYYIETNLGKFDITEQVKDLLEIIQK